ncbi:PucR family transcriptional regulator [Planococcus halocryophilus]|nr:helix-turn-helix domain-containing protein [Planococcus halocryophilus]
MAKIQQNRKRKEENYQDFLWQLLTGQFKNRDEIYEQVHELYLKIPNHFTVLVFYFEQDISQAMEEQISYLITTSQKITNHFLVVMDNELILIASPHPSQSDAKAFDSFITYFTSEIANRFSILGVKGSSGNGYSDFSKAMTSYQEAQKVLELKKYFPEELENVYHYSQLGAFLYIDLIQQELPNEHPAISKIRAYDKLHKSNFLKTLEVFIQKDSNMNEAAKKLFVHTNTLHYRMKRVAEIGEIDLANVHEKLGIYLDLMAQKMTEK